MKIILLISAALLLSQIQCLLAQTEKQDTLFYEYPREIVITGSRLPMPLQEIPFPTSIIGTNIMRTLPRSLAIDEPMKLVPGVKVDNQANGSRIHLSIRGQGILTERGIRGIKILLDEIPINDPTGFAPDLFDVDLNSIERMEVLRGPAASLYGGSASGGIINITTKNILDTSLAGEVVGSCGSNSFWKAYGQIGRQVDNMNYLLSFSKTGGDGYREHTHFWGKNVYAKATFTPATTIKITPIFGWSQFYHENPEGINLLQYQQDPRQPNGDAIPYNEFLETNRITSGLTGLFVLENHEISFNGYVKRTLFTEANNRTFNHRTIVTPGTSCQYTYSYGNTDDFIRNKFSVGTDFQSQTIDEYRVDNLHSKEGDILRSKETIKQDGIGLFAINKIDFGKMWGLMLSLRYDKIKNQLDDILKTQYYPDGTLLGQSDLSGKLDFTKTTGRVGGTFSPFEEMTFYANWGQGFLPPATEELAQNPDQFGGFNKHLTAATSNGFELGARGTYQENIYYDITGFYFTTKNDFDRYRITDPRRTQETFYRNAGSSRRFGLEFYTMITPVKKLTLQLAYTFSHFKYTNSAPIRIMMDDTTIFKYIVDGHWLPNSPMHQLYIDVQYNLSDNIFIGLASETLSKTYIDGANVESEAAEGYTLFNYRIGYTWYLGGMNGEFSLNARNITDRKYVAFTEPDPGGNAYQPGAGMEFFGNLKVHF